jgi:hypothetical protein
MKLRLATMLCSLAIVLSVAAAILHMINLGHFEWKAAAEALGMASLMLLIWSTARAHLADKPRARVGKPPA